MAGTGKILALFAVGQQAAQRYAMRRFLLRLTLIAAAFVVLGVLLAVAFVCALYGSYLMLENYGLSQGAALFCVAGFACVLALLLFSLVQYHIRRASMGVVETTIGGRLRPIAESFMEGWSGRERK